jgi:hypothetical protein
VTLIAYIDESGTHDGSPITVIAGYLSSPDRWATFEMEWADLLEGLRTDHLHAIDLFHGKGSFKGVPLSRRLDIGDQATMIARKYAVVGLSIVLTDFDYRDIFRDASMPKNVSLDSKYGICFRHLVAHLAVLADDDNRISIIAESGHKNQGAAQLILKEYRSTADRLLARRIKTVTFVQKRDCFGVQAADLLAFASLRVERRGDCQFVNTVMTREDVITEQEHASLVRIPVTRESLVFVREEQLRLAKWRRRYGQRALVQH